MTQENSLFETQKETPSDENKGGNPNTPINNPLEDLLKGIVNEKGEQKYRSVADALVGLRHAQSYIPEVKTELRQTQAQLADLQKQAEKVSELEQTIMELTQRGKKEENTSQSSISEESIASMIESTLNNHRQRDTHTTNQTLVRNAIIQRFGDEKAGEVFNAKATELGMSAETLTRLAAESPKAVLAMLGVSGDNANRQFKSSPLSSQVRTTDPSVRTQSLIGNKDAFKLRMGATTADVMKMKANSDQLMDELNSQGVSTHDLTNPSTYFKIFGN